MVIDYLEQLERDLVDAVDRRQPAHARGRRLRRPRPGWRPVATAAAALVAIALVVALVDIGPDEERTVAPPPGPIVMQLDGTLTRIDPTTWQTSARGADGTGTLTITATDVRTALTAGRGIPFLWTTAGGSISGCVTGASERRRAGRVVWSAHGRVTAASGTLGRYRGREVRLAGNTRISTSDPKAPRAPQRQRARSGEPMLLPDQPSC
jgi:hypothetical protein